MCWGANATNGNPGQKVPGQWHSQRTCPLGHVWLCTGRCGAGSWQHVLLPGPAVHLYPTPRGGLGSDAIPPMSPKDGNPSHSCHFALPACPAAILGSPGRSRKLLARPSGSPGRGGGGTGQSGGVPVSLLWAGDVGDSSGRSGLVLTPAGAAAHGRLGIRGAPPASSGTAAGSGCAGRGRGLSQPVPSPPGTTCLHGQRPAAAPGTPPNLSRARLGDLYSAPCSTCSPKHPLVAQWVRARPPPPSRPRQLMGSPRHLQHPDPTPGKGPGWAEPGLGVT